VILADRPARLSVTSRRRASPPRAVTVRVPAKVNLHLGVGARRPDGYHDLVTVFQAVSLYDEVTLSPARRLRVEVRGDGADGVPLGEDNLAARAVRTVAERAGRAPHLRVVISKGIPVAGGMAGGSADAAAALLACDALWGMGLPAAALADLAAALGSDVPFLLSGGTALGTGRGERLSPVLGRGSYHWVFALADAGLPTPSVYAQLDRLRDSGERIGPSPADPVLAALRAGDPAALGRALTNDLQPAALALRPRLQAVLDAGRELGALGSVVCGSGPTVALLAPGAKAAVRLAAGLAGHGLCRTVRAATGPVPGARIAPAEPAGRPRPR
jgi:4-diphosphocytidyl-2-C-methyl-D-erythritol kinase